VLFIAGNQVPETPFVDVVGNVKLPPLHIGAMAANCVVTDGVTVTVRVAAKAHCPEFGVNVYVVVALLLKAGLQVPLILFIDVVGNATNPPLQIVVSGLTIAVAPGAFTVTVMVAVVAHTPVAGVNVYVVVAVLLIAGAHVPVTPFVDVVGKLKLPPLQIAEICVNVGTVLGLTVTASEAVVAQPVPVGVNV